MSWIIFSFIVSASVLLEITESAPVSTIITLEESNLLLWMDNEGRLNLNTSKGGVVQITAWTKQHLNLHYTADTDNRVTLSSEGDMNCKTSNQNGAMIVECNKTASAKPTTTAAPTSRDSRDLKEKDVIGIVVAAVLTAVIIIVVAFLIIRGKSMKEKQREIEEREGMANDAFDQHHDQENHPQPPTVVVHRSEPNGNHTLSASLEGLVSAPDTPTMQPKRDENNTNSTYL